MVTYSFPHFNYKIAESTALKGCTKYHEGIYMVGNSSFPTWDFNDYFRLMDKREVEKPSKTGTFSSA